MAARGSSKLGLALIACAVLASACHKQDDATTPPPDDDTSFAEDATDTSAAETDAQILAGSLIASSSTGSLGLASLDPSADIAPRAIGDAVKATYFPRTCVTVTPDTAKAEVTYKFNGCLGPNGLVGVTGEVQAHYVAGPDHLHLDLVASGLSVNDASVDWSASADITATDTVRTMVWKAQLSGTSAGHRDFARTTEQTLTWTPGEACFAINGASEGTIAKRDIRSEISAFRRCKRSCPDAGGKIVVTNVATQRRVEILYDGTNQARFVRPNGVTVTVPLRCRL